MEILEKESNYKIIIFFIIVFALFLEIVIIPRFFSDYYSILNLIFWIIIAVFSENLNNQHNNFKSKKETLKTVFIIVSIYLILYYLSGFIFGFAKNVLTNSLKNIIINFIMYIAIIPFQEYTRSRVINNTRSKLVYILITLALILSSINYVSFMSNFLTGSVAFEYIAGTIFPLVLEGILCSFLVKKGSYVLSLMFILPLKCADIFVPIVPNMDWFIKVSYVSALVIVVYYFANYEYRINVERFTRREIREDDPKKSIPAVIFVMLFTFFVAGIFPLKPVALLSNSMYPNIKRGDVVIVKKLKHEDLRTLCIGDVIEYKIDNTSIVHRIIRIDEATSGEFTFITKGDSNSSEDLPVKESQVVGLTRQYVPYVGYPSVWFSEQILNINQYKGENWNGKF